MPNLDRDPGLEIALAAAGGVRALSRIVGRTSATVAVWKTIPIKHVLRIEDMTGIPRHELRPDVYPPVEQKRAKVRWA